MQNVPAGQMEEAKNLKTSEREPVQSVARQTNSKCLVNFNCWQICLHGGGFTGGDESNEWRTTNGGAVDNIISTRWMANCPWGYKWNLKLFYQHFWLLPAEQLYRGHGRLAEWQNGWQSLTLMDAIHWQSKHSDPNNMHRSYEFPHNNNGSLNENGRGFSEQYVSWTMEMINLRVSYPQPQLPQNEFRAMLIIISWIQPRMMVPLAARILI